MVFEHIKWPLMPLTKPGERVNFLAAQPSFKKKTTAPLSLSQIREQLQHVTFHLRDLCAGLSH